MNKFYRFICLVAVFTIVCCCFTGCFRGPIDIGDVDTEDTTTVNEGETTVDISDTPTIGSTKNIVTNYESCLIYWPDGRVFCGDVTSWILISENLIQVTLTNVGEFGSKYVFNDGKAITYLLSPDRIALCT